MQVTAFVDWGNDEHEVAILVGDSTRVHTLRVTNDADGLARLHRSLFDRSAGRAGDVRVGIERCDGPIVDTMLDAGFCVFAINPKQIERFRTFLCVSGAKDDRLDAKVGALALQSHPEAFDRIEEQDPRVVRLRDCARLHVELVKEETQLSNQIREQLQRFYPEFLALGSLSVRWVRAVYALAPTPQKAARLTAARLKKALKGSRQDAEHVLKKLRGPSVTSAPGVVEGATFRVRSGLRRLEQVLTDKAECHKLTEELLEELAANTAALSGLGVTSEANEQGRPSDIAIIRSVPGLGRVTAPALVAWAWPLIQARDADALARRCGARPVSVQTGKRQNRFNPKNPPRVHMRFACNRHLRNMMHHAGATAAQHDPFYKDKYATSRGRGHTHGRACRNVAEHLLRVLVACLKAGELYDPELLAKKLTSEQTPSSAEIEA